jgi:predicted deacetylase
MSPTARSPARRELCVVLPVTLLVIPQRHGDPAAPRPYLRWLRRLAREGHELALHGLTHRDEGPPPRGWREHLMRRWYIAGEGEFAGLDAGVEWTCTLDHLTALPRGPVRPAWALTCSTRSPGRRWASLAWNRTLERQHHGAELCGLELHPDDAHHTLIRHQWSGWLARALRERRPLSLGQAAGA